MLLNNLGVFFSAWQFDSLKSPKEADIKDISIPHQNLVVSGKQRRRVE